MEQIPSQDLSSRRNIGYMILEFRRRLTEELQRVGIVRADTQYALDNAQSRHIVSELSKEFGLDQFESTAMITILCTRLPADSGIV